MRTVCSVDLNPFEDQGTRASRRGIRPANRLHSSTVANSFRVMRPDEANMRVIPDDLTILTEAQEGSSEARTAPLLTLPISCHHTVRSVAQEAYRSLWTDGPDRAERWRRVSNMDQLFGVGRPLRTMSNAVVQAVIREMGEMEMPEEVIRQHLDDFGCLMLWADDWGFVQWGRQSDRGATGQR